MQTTIIKFCKIPGHQSKRITKICISPHNCSNRYLCDLCIKTNHQELPIDQYLIRLKNQHNELININKMDELTHTIFRDLNKYRRFIESQFDQFESKLRSIQTNIQNAYQNALFILEQLYKNPFNEEVLNRNIQIIHDEKKRECENYLKKGQQLLKQQYNIMYERTTNFKLINQTTKLQIGWQLKGLEENLNMQDKKGQSDPLQQGYWTITIEGQSHIRGGGRYYDGQKVGEWIEIIRDGPYQYHQVINIYENGKLIKSEDNQYCDLSAEVIEILDEYEKLDKKQSEKQSISLYSSPKAMSGLRSRPGSVSNINRSSRKMEKY